MTARWSPYAQLILGVWLINNPFTFGYHDQPMAVSDWVSGAAIAFFSVRSLRSTALWPQWVNALVGVWLLLAPLVFWASEAAAFGSGMLIGTLIIAFSLVLPRNPIERPWTGTEIPPGWSYNPSEWNQRAPIIGMALFGFFVAQYMAAFQLGYIPDVWDPFFGDGTRRVLHSEVSRAFPVSDAGLGAVSYLIEALTGFIGGTRRWRTMPWMVMLFGVLVVPLGVVSIVLIILQPIAVGAWCSLCLATALAMLLMISPAADEVIATMQFLQQSRRAGGPFWMTVWKGGSVEVAGVSNRVAGRSVSWSSWLGFNYLTWTLILSAGLGIWLMFSPSMFASSGLAAHSDHLVGPLVVTVAVIAMGEIGRSVRWVNVLLGAWLLLAPWIFSGTTTMSRINDNVIGGGLIILAIPRGRVRETFGAFDRFLR